MIPSHFLPASMFNFPMLRLAQSLGPKLRNVVATATGYVSLKLITKAPMTPESPGPQHSYTRDDGFGNSGAPDRPLNPKPKEATDK